MMKTISEPAITGGSYPLGMRSNSSCEDCDVVPCAFALPEPKLKAYILILSLAQNCENKSIILSEE